MILDSKEQIIKEIESQLKDSIIARLNLSEQSVFNALNDMRIFIESKNYKLVNEICGVCEFMAEHRFYHVCEMIEDWEAMNVFEDRIYRWKNLKDEGYKKGMNK